MCCYRNPKILSGSRFFFPQLSHLYMWPSPHACHLMIITWLLHFQHYLLDPRRRKGRVTGSRVWLFFRNFPGSPIYSYKSWAYTKGSPFVIDQKSVMWIFLAAREAGRYIFFNDWIDTLNKAVFLLIWMKRKIASSASYML